jgi:hypothetical protein
MPSILDRAFKGEKMFDTISQLAAEWILPALFFWLVLCLAATSLQEGLEHRLHIRSRMLKSSILHMLGDAELTRKFFDHPLILTIMAPLSRKSKGEHTNEHQQLTHIQPRLFAQIVLDLVLHEEEASNTKKKSTRLNQQLINVQAVHSKYPQLAQVLETLMLDRSEQESTFAERFASLQINLENWFDAAMKETSRHYQRYVQYMLLVVGMMLAVYINFDPIALTTQLWNQSTAEGQTASQDDGNPKNSELPIGWKIIVDANCGLFPHEGQIFGFPISIGRSNCISPLTSSTNTNVILKLAGFIIGGFSIAIGSQYVYDLWKNQIQT